MNTLMLEDGMTDFEDQAQQEERRQREENMRLWRSVEKTNPLHTKKANNGRYEFTNINATYQTKMATEQWGSFGKHWGVKDEKFDLHTIDPITFCNYTAILYYPDNGECPIASSIGVVKPNKNGTMTLDHEYSKKVKTDALTKGLSMLGFNADVFLGRFDDSKYVEDLKQEFRWIDYKDVIHEIKRYIAEDNLSAAAEIWFELDDSEKEELWVAPTKGGPWTTDERNIMKSTEFREAHYGPDDNQEEAA